MEKANGFVGYAALRKLAEQADNLVTKMQMIADNLADYNPGLCKDKVPIETIQYDLGCLGRELTWFYAEIEKKNKLRGGR